MNIENYIESKCMDLFLNGEPTPEFLGLYSEFEYPRLRELLATLHSEYTRLFRRMNERLPTNENVAHFWAVESRSLIYIIERTLDLYNTLKNTEYSFQINDYYFSLIQKCRDFLRKSDGSTLPPHMETI